MGLEDVDHFLVDKVKAKLKYWNSTHLSLAGITLIVNQVLISFLWYFLRFGLAQRKPYVGLWLCFATIFGMVLRTLQEHMWGGTIVQCQRKLGGRLSLTSLEKLCKYSRVNELFRLSSMASQTCKFCWGTASHNCNLLAMDHGVHPWYGCSPRIFISKTGRKFGTTLLNCGRWWHQTISFISSPRPENISQMNPCWED